MTRKICVVTGSRADYGLLQWALQRIQDDPDLKLQLVATGMHLSPEFGLTYRVIEQDGYGIDRKVEMLVSSDSATGLTKSMGLGLIGFADAFAELKPDLVVVLGDRYEIFSAATAALIANIPIAHLHGGEITEGSFDESLRHAITKMSNFHFVAAEEYRRRIIQLGERPEHVFLVGGLGIESINRIPLLSRGELENSLGFKLGPKNLLVTFHPVTRNSSSGAHQMRELLASLGALKDTKLIFTMSNADTCGRELMYQVQEFVARSPEKSRVFTSLGQQRYLSCVSQVDGVVGNSSSGLLEVPSFKKGTINIGDRQKGRLEAISVINCEPTQEGISNALKKLFSAEFQAQLLDVVNPYGEGNASTKIIDILKGLSFSGCTQKSFYDLPFNKQH